MNYKELLNRYKKGLASEEEKQLIEEELEKQEAFEEYTSEIFDEELDSLTESPSMDMHSEETSKLKKSVNKRLRKVVLASVLAVVALYFIVFYVISGIVDRAYYDPTAVSQPKEEGYQFEDFRYDMQAYISLNMPGFSMNSLTTHDSKGFGKYEASYSMKNLFTNSEQRYFVDISRGKLSSKMDGIFSSKNRFWLWEGFSKIQHNFPKDASEKSIDMRNEYINQNNEETIRYLNELNPLAYISMSIVFNEDLNMEEFSNMNLEYDGIKFKWVGIRTVTPDTRWSENQPMHLIGFNPSSNDEASSNLRPNPKKYPFFYIEDFWDSSLFTEKGPQEAMPEVYETHFKSRIQYLRGQEEFVEIFDYNYLKTDFYDDALKYIDENGVKTYGVLVYGTAREFLESIDKIPYDSIYINEVLAAKPNIYNN